jgi:hypothetical protein
MLACVSGLRTRISDTGFRSKVADDAFFNLALMLGSGSANGVWILGSSDKKCRFERVCAGIWLFWSPLAPALPRKW